MDTLVIGAGIIGVTIAKALRARLGQEVAIYDDDDSQAGTKASGGSVKPSHLTGLSSDDEKPVLALLDELYGLHKENFVIRPSGGLLKADVYQINMDLVREEPRIPARAVKLSKTKSGKPAVIFEDGSFASADTVIVAAGMGCATLIPSMAKDLFAKKGVSFIFDGEVEQAFVQAWAPYKQITVHNTTYYGQSMVWGSDGTALKPDNWDEGRTNSCLERVMHAAELDGGPAYINTGLRPFHTDKKAKPCYMAEVSPGVIVVTGAGKFGNIAAGWAANQLTQDGNN